MVALPCTYKDKTMRLLAILGVVVLAGCSGIDPGKTYPTETFVAPITYQEACRRAQNHARTCLSVYEVSGDLFTDNRTGIVRVQIPKFTYTGNESMQFKVAQESDQSTKIEIVVDGVGVFDQRQLVAARKTIETGNPACR